MAADLQVVPDLPPSDSFEPLTVLVDVPAQLLATAAFRLYEAKVKEAHPEAHDVAIVGVKPEGGISLEVTGMWRPAPAAAVKTDADLAETRLGTVERATAYLNQLLIDHLNALLGEFNRTAHAGATPDDRKDAHLVAGVARGAVRALEQTNMKLMERRAPVLLVTADSKPDAPPPGGRR